MPSSAEASDCKVDVQQTPTIAIESKHKTQSVDKDATITVNATLAGCPTPDVKLYHNNTPVVETRVRVKVDDGKVTATITKASAQDCGDWHLEANNTHGTAKDHFTIHVRDVPAPVKRLDVKDVDKTEMTVTWQQPDNDGGSAITGYVCKHLRY